MIVNASEESDSIRALNKRTGETVWVRPSAKLEGSSISPMIAGSGDNAVLVVPLASEVWGLVPETGEVLWQIDTETATGMVPTPVADDAVVYTFGGSGKSHAVRFARKLPQDSERVAWSSKQNLGIPSPLLHDGKLFLCKSDGTATCLRAADGEVLFRGRLDGRTGKIYASPTLCGDRIYLVSRERGTYVYKADETLELLAHNTIDSDESRFDGSPAIVGDRIYLRSQKFLYCIREDEK